MVLASSPSLLPEDGPLALLRLRRAEADAQLPKSLMTASLLALTFVVALMLAQVLLHSDAPRVIVIDFFQPPNAPNAPKPYVPGAPLPPAVPIPKIPNGFEVVDGAPPPEALIDTIRPAVPSYPGVGNPGTIDPNAVGTGHEGTAVSDALPTPKEYVYRDVEPEVISRVIPLYPPIAREAGMEGTVMVRLLVGLDGRVMKAEIESSSAMFDDAALIAGRQWVFAPALANGHPVRVWVRMPVKFQLH
jgi:protein TonB